MATAQKILNGISLQAQLEQWKNQKKSIVFTNGCFDILHLGHIDYLEKAKALGDVLIIGLNSDVSVQRFKGPMRPINPMQARARVLAALAFVDVVTIFEEDTPEALIKVVKPHVLVKGGDYQIQAIVGARFVTQHGGVVKTIPLVAGFSTSNLLNKIKQQ